MSDIVERARSKSGMLKMGERIAFGSDAELIDEMAAEIERLRFDIEQCRTEAVAMLDKAVMEQSRLRSLLKEAGEALEKICNPPDDEMHDGFYGRDVARTVLSKIKGDA